ncbi:MAG: 50S ribosomal protein L11 methyltransferase [Ruthenibacterium sp.]
MEWTDLQITVPAAYAQTAEAVAAGIASGGIYIEDYRDLEQQVQEIAHVDLIEQDLLDKDRTKVLVHLYFSPDENAAELIELVQSRLSREEIPFALARQGVQQEDWETGWKAYYHPLEIGNRLAIVPSWEDYVTDRTIITLDPGMAFGTGTHETTALCLGALDALVQGGERVLDIGTGSGILAIAALKLGAASADGVDIDPMCVRTAGENAALNGVQERFQVLIGDLSDKASGTYDIICANIVANAIKALAPEVPALLKADGTFIASGIIDTRRDEVVDALQQTGLAVCEIKEENGWVALLCRHAAQG